MVACPDFLLSKAKIWTRVCLPVADLLEKKDHLIECLSMRSAGFKNGFSGTHQMVEIPARTLGVKNGTQVPAPGQTKRAL